MWRRLKEGTRLCGVREAARRVGKCGIIRAMGKESEEAGREVSGASGIGPVALAVFLALAVLYLALLTRGTFAPLGEELLGGAFDSLAEGFLRGTSEVDPEAIRWEAFVVDGRAYMYFGPWPALIRMPAALVLPEFAGSWARLSCWVAALVALGGFAQLVRSAIERNRHLEAEHRRFLFVTSLVGFGVASPLLFLVNAASIYHESIVWALAGSLCFCAIAAPRFGDTPALIEKLGWLSAIAGATLLARVTYAGPLYLLLLFVAFRGWRAGSSLGLLFVRLLPAGLCLLFQLWYNFDRFGSPLTFVDYSLMGFMRADPSTLEILGRTGDFSGARILVALINYFVPGAGQFAGSFPWFRLAPPVYPDAGLYPRIFTSWVMPLTLIASWAVFGGLAGWILALRDRTQRLHLVFGAALLLQALLVSAYYIMELRYEVDLLPLFVVGYALFVANLGAPGFFTSRVQDMLTVLIFAVALSSIVSVSTTISAIAVGGPAHPKEYKQSWDARIDAVNRLWPGRRSP